MANIYLVNSEFLFYIELYLSLIDFFPQFVGLVQRLCGPLFEGLKCHVDKCSWGYIQITLNLLCDVDSAIQYNDTINLRLLFKVYNNCFEQLILFLRNECLYGALRQGIKENYQQQAELSNGCLNLSSLNEFFVNVTNDLNDKLNQCQCPCQCERPCN